MSQLDASEIRPFLTIASEVKQPDQCILVLQSLTRLPLRSDAWIAAAGVVRRLLRELPQTSPHFPALVSAAAGVPVRSIRGELTVLANDWDHPHCRVAALALAQHGDAAAARTLLAAVGSGGGEDNSRGGLEAGHRLAGITLEPGAVTAKRLDYVLSGLDFGGQVWISIALARGGDLTLLDRLLQGLATGDLPPRRSTWTDPRHSSFLYELLVALRPLPDSIQDFLMQRFAGQEKMPRPAELLISGLTGVADRTWRPWQPASLAETPRLQQPDPRVTRRIGARLTRKPLRADLQLNATDEELAHLSALSPSAAAPIVVGLIKHLFERSRPGENRARVRRGRLRTDRRWERRALLRLMYALPSPIPLPLLQLIQMLGSPSDAFSWALSRAGARALVQELGPAAESATDASARKNLIEWFESISRHLGEQRYKLPLKSVEPARASSLIVDDIKRLGIVKRLARDKGFGFISTDDDGEYFFHRSAIGAIGFEHLLEGEQVSFTITEGRTGVRANGVEVVPERVGSVADPPRSGYARLDCPDVVTVSVEFEIVVGLTAEQNPKVVGERLQRPATSHGPYNLVVHVIAPGFSLREGEKARNVLAVTAEEPWPCVTLHLTSAPEQAEMRPATLQAIYSVDGQTIGFAVRAMVLRATVDAVPPPVVQPAGNVDVTVPSARDAPDMTVRISVDNDVEGRLLWTFETRFSTISVPQDTIETYIGRDSQGFARQLVDRINLQEGKPGLSAFLRGIGREIAAKIPAAFWSLLRLAGQEASKTPTVLILSEEPHVPWELAIMDDPLLDLDAQPFLAAQVTVGRWVLRHGIKLPPPLDRSAERLAVVWGEYKGGRWLRLLQAEGEAADLTKTYGAVDVKAVMDDVLECLAGRPPADLLHFAMHGQYDPSGIQDGLALVDGSFLEPSHIAGVQLSGAPFVFLNACQVGSGSRVLGDYAGMAAAFLSVGATGVIAPLWSVKDTIARQIAERFYEQVFIGVPAAEALRIARSGVSMTGATPSATGLAYQFFGHPSLRLRRA